MVNDVTFDELLEVAKSIEITDEDVQTLCQDLIQQGLDSEEAERRNYSSEVMNRTYNL